MASRDQKNADAIAAKATSVEEAYNNAPPVKQMLPATRPVFDGAMLQRRYLDDARLDYHTSLPCTTAEEKRVVANVLNVGGDMLGQQVNLTLDVVHVTVAPVDYVSRETGEETPGLRVILTTADGKHYSCGGVGPVRAIRRIAAIYGPPPFAPAVRVRVKPIPLGDGKSTYTLEVV